MAKFRLILFLAILGATLSGCQFIKFFSSDENCVEKLKEATTCGALGEKNFENCKNVADDVAAAASASSGEVVSPDYSSCDNDRLVIQSYCYSTVKDRCL